MTQFEIFSILISFFLIFLTFIFERETDRQTDRQSMSWGGAEREGDTKSEAAPGSKLSEPDVGLELTDHEIMT